MVKLFCTGALYMLLIGINTYQIIHELWVGVGAVSFLTGLIWSINVKKIVFSNWKYRIAYALGAACGCLAGLLICKILYS
jgi:hypothetical protein